MKLPKVIKEFIIDEKMEEIKDFHVSGDAVFNISSKYILKVSNNLSRLENEYRKDEWFSKVIPSAKPLLFVVEDNVAYYLREYIDGENLCLSKYLERPLVLIKLLKEALDIFHTINASECPFKVGEGNVVIHGDFCLPNILVKNDHVVGFIDLGDAGLGDIWIDYAWCIWSFEYNLNTKAYTNELINALGIEFDNEKFIKYTNE